MLSYEESVLELADDYGCLKLKDAKQLFEEHGSNWDAHFLEGRTLNAEKFELAGLLNPQKITEKI